MTDQIHTVDFETYPIEGNPSVNPPKPVGVSIKKGNGPSQYFAFGHPSENNCTFREARMALAGIWDGPLLFHNGKFDVSVALAHMDLPMPYPRMVHDTMYLLFLNDPYSDNLSLKPNAETLLNWPAEERDELVDWIMLNTECSSRKKAGAWIWAAPGDLVGKYAEADTDMTRGLFNHLMPRIATRQMIDAYELEQDLMPITYYSERKGVRVDVEKLGRDIQKYEIALDIANRELEKKLGKDADFSTPARLADCLEAAGIVNPDDWLTTPKGRRSASKESLAHAIQKAEDAEVLHLLDYRSSVSSALQTFARPWHEIASQGDGRIHTSWNQVRTHDAGNKDSRGSRTGRLSGSKPSLMNVTNEIKIVVPDDLPTPPLMRQYLLPEEGHYWLKRDYSSQEVRMLAHFEDGDLMGAYQENPELDPHEMARKMVLEITGVEFTRKDIKITAFSIIYGSSVTGLAAQLGRSHYEAALVRDTYLKIFPGVKKLQKIVSNRGRKGSSIRTWNHREYFKEPSKIVKGKKMDFSYKLLNYLIQGSSADQTKWCIRDWWERKGPFDIFLATVHDEIDISAPIDEWETSMEVLKDCMNQPLLDVPTRSEGFYGPNWFDLEECA